MKFEKRGPDMSEPRLYGRLAGVQTVAILLAAGKGTRMRSDLAKVLHPFAGDPLVLYPLRAARRFGVQRSIVVVGHQAEQVRQGNLIAHLAE